MNKKSGISEKDKKLLLLVVAFALLALVYVVLVRPMQDKIQEKNEEYSTISLQKAEMQAIIEDPELEVKMEEERAKALINYNFFFGVLNGYSIDSIINEKVSTMNLSISKLSVDNTYTPAQEDRLTKQADIIEETYINSEDEGITKEEEAKILMSCNVEVVIEGGYNNIMGFIDELSDTSDCIEIISMTLSKTSPEANYSVGEVSQIMPQNYPVETEGDTIDIDEYEEYDDNEDYDDEYTVGYDEDENINKNRVGSNSNSSGTYNIEDSSLYKATIKMTMYGIDNSNISEFQQMQEETANASTSAYDDEDLTLGVDSNINDPEPILDNESNDSKDNIEDEYTGEDFNNEGEYTDEGFDDEDDYMDEEDFDERAREEGRSDSEKEPPRDDMVEYEDEYEDDNQNYSDVEMYYDEDTGDMFYYDEDGNQVYTGENYYN